MTNHRDDSAGKGSFRVVITVGGSIEEGHVANYFRTLGVYAYLSGNANTMEGWVLSVWMTENVAESLATMIRSDLGVCACTEGDRW